MQRRQVRCDLNSKLVIAMESARTPTRRSWLAGAAAAPFDATKPLRIAVMSKFFQFLDVPAMARAIAGMGFDGIDLCVRPGAHITPERVEEDLPRAAEAIRAAGLGLPMITTAILDVETPHAERVLRTAGKLCIRHYRWGGFRYHLDKYIPPQLESLKTRVAGLAALNRQHGMCAMYHTHSGPGQAGASIWDLWYLLKDFDPRWVSVNLDIGHATVEGGFGGWIHATRLILPYTRGIAIKDFRWGRNGKGAWVPQWCPLGEGMVDFRRYLPMLKDAGFDGPVQMHYEYPLGGADTGSRRPDMAPEQIYAAMRKDLTLLRQWFKEAGLA